MCHSLFKGISYGTRSISPEQYIGFTGLSVGGYQLRLAKLALDVCLVTNSADAVLEFWRDSVGLYCEEVLPIREGLTQHRHSVAGSVITISR
jgi:hypothetical protein